MILEMIGAVFLVLGVFFFAVGVLGVIRLPDAYSRLHASGKVGTLGLFGLCIGTAFLMPAAALKLLGLALFMVLSAPLASHAIALGVQRGSEAVHARQSRNVHPLD